MHGKLHKAGFLYLLIFTAALVIAGGGQVVDKTYSNLYLHVDSSTGDVIQVLGLTPSYGIDSFLYACTVMTAALDSSYGYFTSPSQKMIFTIGVVTATPTLIDTITIGPIGCTVVYASTGERGIEYDPSTGADATLAVALDGIKALWDAFDDLDDSISCEDSGTYLKLRSLESEIDFGGRWSMQLGSSAGAPTDSLDTASVITTDTIAVEGMAAAINLDATLAAAITASTSNDTLILTSDDAGTPFTWIGADSTGDHTGDTNTIVVNVAGNSTIQDTFDLVQLIHDNYVYNQVYASFVLGASATEKQGYGLSDSGYLWLYTVFNGVFHLLDSAVANSLPVTLTVRLPDSIDISHGMDTLFKERLSLVWRVSDTASDTIMNVTHSIEANWILKDRN